jgi:hypothetical protein
VNCGQHKRPTEERCPHCGYKTGIQDDESDSAEPQTIYGPVPWLDTPPPQPAPVSVPPPWANKQDNPGDTPARPISAPVYGPPPIALRRPDEQLVVRTSYSKFVTIIGAIVGILLLLWLLY